MIILFNTNCNVNEMLVKRWLERNNVDSEITFIKNNLQDSLIPIQPINSGCKLTCNDKLTSLKNNLEDLCDMILLIDENIEIHNDKILFYYFASLVNVNTDSKTESKSEVLEIKYDILEKHSYFLDIISYLEDIYLTSKNNYIYDGCSLTFSNIINKKNSKLTEDNWMEEIFNKSKSEIIDNLLNKLELDI